MHTVITFGTFDLFHVGHLNILLRARALGDHLVVGVSSDALNLRKKGRRPVFDERARMSIVSHIKGIDETFLEESLEAKAAYIRNYQADTLVMGDDWRGKFDFLQRYCEVIYLERTPAVSTTSVIEELKQLA